MISMVCKIVPEHLAPATLLGARSEAGMPPILSPEALEYALTEPGTIVIPKRIAIPAETELQIL